MRSPKPKDIAFTAVTIILAWSLLQAPFRQLAIASSLAHILALLWDHPRARSAAALGLWAAFLIPLGLWLENNPEASTVTLAAPVFTALYLFVVLGFGGLAYFTHRLNQTVEDLPPPAYGQSQTDHIAALAETNPSAKHAQRYERARALIFLGMVFAILILIIAETLTGSG